jgi:hypothetical protein
MFPDLIIKEWKISAPQAEDDENPAMNRTYWCENKPLYTFTMASFK